MSDGGDGDGPRSTGSESILKKKKPMGPTLPTDVASKLDDDEFYELFDFPRCHAIKIRGVAL